ncbi:succinylglutamate desuccinylase/aspartoacylase family protein [Notoacmeibacter sp. MSK16QG-6]|uniref:succinylglutamate desuccinylase/aspartoacylase family protein n=1 Tax=Notoacmeibacter sp. MSK16QG-6 TaxID=2957982 RepID=UPI00209E5BFA|nr:succinylglutamate desuccinylase/aspartoacylase family protein [Notoacmeibacter sp. MSK16QG-6]MCP1200531.1 succinylglutamate desuccinylase/aspartoacylase family protein [Notoacmeibacter sp. MSK16QG-6]
MSSQVWTSIDFEKPGFQADFARVPNSSNTSAYGWLPVPMLCFNGGEGPTLLLTAGTHGDEYEGQIALRRLIRTLADTELRGRVIVLPALNQPAVIAGRRNSPLDGGNLNRLFPGSDDAGPTAMIAQYITEVLFPLTDYAIDLHSGGSSLDYLPVAFAHRGRTAEQSARLDRLLECFAAPNTVLTDGRGGGGTTTLYASANAHGIAAMTTELGGGPGLSPAGVTLGEAGVRRVLRDLRIAPGLDAPDPQRTRHLRMLPPVMTVYASANGLFEPCVKVGQEVQAGEIAGHLHGFDDVTRPSETLRFQSGGIVIFRRFPVLTAPGDALAGLAAPVTRGSA